jgi:1-deoxy-D-xylulose-5-phosphate reductoisomerase
MTKRLIILGSTGSIGRRTLDVVRDFPDRFEVVGLSANTDIATLAAQAREFRPRALCVCAPEALSAAEDLAAACGARLHLGRPGLVELIEEHDADIVVVATVGFVGLLPTLRAIELGRTIALANKEVLVTAGDLVMESARAHGATILPIDSEHNAVLQCLNGSGPERVRRIILTASGGPFRGRTRDELARVTPAEALDHPTWRMGPKITVDSATLMNKGFEVIEGKHLFNVPVARIEVVIHPQSIVHSMVEYVDGSILAQLGVTDMYLPIQNVLFYPERVANTHPSLDFPALGMLSFESPDSGTFPCLRLAREAAEAGGTCPAVLNAANEVAVERFLAGDLGFLRIPAVVEDALEAHDRGPARCLADIMSADEWARAHARRV